jgi:copper chaperone NosL
LNKIITVFIIIAIIVVLFLSMSNQQNMTVIVKENHSQQPVPIILGKFQDSDCGMIIEDLSYASQVISPSGATWFFHDHGGMINWLSNKPFKKEAKIWVMSKDTNQWIDGRNAWYSRTENTPMNYGFGAYEKKEDSLINFQTMSLHMLRGEHLGNPQIKKELLGK